jgi:hypothetical protein
MTSILPRCALAVLALLPLAAPAQAPDLGDQRLAPIDDPLRVEFRNPPADLSADKVRQVISIVGNVTGWKTVSEGADAVQLTRTVNGRHVMKIEIVYDPAGYDIRYVDSTELLFRTVTVSGLPVRAIHKNYNTWIRELATAIDAGLGLGASMTVATSPRGAPPARPAVPAAAAAAATSSRASERLPLPGDYWKYSFRDERYKHRPEHFTISVTAVRGWTVSDLLERETGDAAHLLRKSIDAQALAFVGRRLSEEHLTWELSPYLGATATAESLRTGEVPELQLKGWKLQISAVQQERVQVPAGSFDATRVEVAGKPEYPPRATLAPSRLRYTIWYAPEAKRYVMLRHQTWTLSGGVAADEIVRLEEYRLK